MRTYRALFDAHVERWSRGLPAGDLHAPMAYLLALPAKRVRPVLTLMACELFGGDPRTALDQALAIELFHNFTLMHDDIMDAAPLRRGQPTVHARWNVNTAILSGDAMLVMAYTALGPDPNVLAVFNRHALEVCAGQQLDMDFEQRDDVGLSEYKEMIRMKTAVLLAAALRIGAIRAGAGEADQERIAGFGEGVGLAFQLRDDLLDAFGDPAVTGKEQGGDLRNGKKTWLLIRGLEVEREHGSSVLREQLAMDASERDVATMITALRELGVEQEAQAEVERLAGTALDQLHLIDPNGDRTAALRALAVSLIERAA